MINPWHLPTRAQIGGREYALHCDYRDVLEMFSYFQDPDLPEYLRWRIALALFYEEQIPEEHRQEAMAYLARFLNGGEDAPQRPSARLLDWQQDAQIIVADINKVAGQEIRSLPFVHWWTFLSWFHAIGEGQLSTLISLRQKLQKGKKLEDWEKSYYRENKQKVDLSPHYSREELDYRAELETLLGEAPLPIHNSK